jgi:hypothetical protein
VYFTRISVPIGIITLATGGSSDDLVIWNVLLIVVMLALISNMPLLLENLTSGGGGVEATTVEVVEVAATTPISYGRVTPTAATKTTAASAMVDCISRRSATFMCTH